MFIGFWDIGTSLCINIPEHQFCFADVKDDVYVTLDSMKLGELVFVFDTEQSARKLVQNKARTLMVDFEEIFDRTIDETNDAAKKFVDMDNGGRSARNELFQLLKPRCVELTQLALRDDGSPNSTKSLVTTTSQVLVILEKHCKRPDGAFDEKLAEYVFFPLSQMLKKKKKYTDHLAELIVKCIRVLLDSGWSRKIPLGLASQLLILLAFIVGGPPDEKQLIPEEIVSEGYGALVALFDAMALTPGGSAALVESATVPALGHCMTVILEGITDGPSAQVQLQALAALDSAWRSIKDSQALATFLPGTISGLTKTLMPATTARRSRRTLINALEVLERVLSSTLSDIHTSGIRNTVKIPKSTAESEINQKVFTPAWLKATTAQIKLALSNVVRLRKNDGPGVRQALNRFCLRILDECHETLFESTSLLVETCMALDEDEIKDDFFAEKTTLTDLAIIHPDIGELVKTTSYNWVTSLPRLMQSNDEAAKSEAIERLQRASRLVKNLGIDSAVLEDALGSSLRDSITLTLESLPSSAGLQEAEFNPNSQAVTSLVKHENQEIQFRPIIMAEESQKKTRQSLVGLVTNLGSREAQLKLGGEMLEYVQNASGPSLVAAYWLSFQSLQAAANANKEMDEFFETALTLSDEQEAMDEELMAYSQLILANGSEEQYDWLMQAIALEVVADRAMRLKKKFRPELIDTLYPIVQLLGSPNDRLRDHAISCLFLLSDSCGYGSASELIVDNVDYMVNSISLRLNTFDISPQTPQVLVMMLHLTGPSLLLYLDDVVGSIFAALDNFHGYQNLVDTLFTVLDEIVKVGSTSNQLQITDTPDEPIMDKSPPTISQLITLLSTSSIDEESLPYEPTPHQPWKSAATLLDEAEARTNSPSSSDNEEEGFPPAQELEPAKPTKIHTLLKNITSLSQHYLTSPSPHLRTKLLSLIATASPGLAGLQRTFLPLINEIWPVVVNLLHDDSAYVVVTAMSTIATLAEQAAGWYPIECSYFTI
ncbi:putative TEL2-interacting protein 1 [Glarea lozoyensis 74030]|uniref:Putative TEL2-interacting protein 1 n=1 Tax=Glarea lozoyensis (strain ATCC 74030 / MF5533) TaxID=1104152 RepID=H0EJ82_GLAL7|nr:putative TEL2-interacting protein 1 [Glarea lozoyensis 74030]